MEPARAAAGLRPTLNAADCYPGLLANRRRSARVTSRSCYTDDGLGLLGSVMPHLPPCTSLHHSWQLSP
jgi:hypothetical protein